MGTSGRARRVAPASRVVIALGVVPGDRARGRRRRSRRPATTREGSPRKHSAVEARLSSIKVIEEGWKKAGVKPAKPATDEEFLRRAYLDLLGRIPNVQEARAFLQHAREATSGTSWSSTCSIIPTSPRISRPSGRSS